MPQMFDTLLGEGSYAFRFIIAFIVLLGLIALTVWLVRRSAGERLGSAAARSRQPRLAVIDAATVDERHRLVLIRRDNVEHLLIIGGPTDVVVEQNIVRGAPAAPARGSVASDTVPRGVPLGEGTVWSLQPEPARAEPMLRAEPMPHTEPMRRLEAAPRLEPARRPPRAAPSPLSAAPPVVEEQTQWSAEPEQPPVPPQRERRPRPVDPLAGPAEELSRVPTAPEPADTDPLPREQPSREPQMREAPVGDAPPRLPLPRREPRVARPQAAPPPPTPPPAPYAPEPRLNSSAVQNLSAMVPRLEAALRRPVKTQEDRPAGWATLAASEQADAEPSDTDLRDGSPP